MEEGKDGRACAIFETDGVARKAVRTASFSEEGTKKIMCSIHSSYAMEVASVTEEVAVAFLAIAVGRLSLHLHDV